MDTRAPSRPAPVTVNEEIEALKKQTVRQLQDRFAALYGGESRSFNRNYLWKKIAWKLQELREGGLSGEDKALAADLARGAELRSRPPAGALAAVAATLARDARLPPVGTVLRREHAGDQHEVTVLEDGFEYRGARYSSLSRVARAIAGVPWNGYVWFGLTRRRRGGEAA